MHVVLESGLCNPEALDQNPQSALLKTSNSLDFKAINDQEEHVRYQTPPCGVLCQGTSLPQETLGRGHPNPCAKASLKKQSLPDCKLVGFVPIVSIVFPFLV